MYYTRYIKCTETPEYLKR